MSIERRIFVVCLLIGTISALVGARLQIFATHEVSSAAAWRQKLAVERSVALGLLPAGRPAQAIVAIRNDGNDVIHVARIRTSCPCIRAVPDHLVVDAHDKVQLVLVYDPAEDPDFRGPLAVEVKGSGRCDETLFALEVNLCITGDVALPDSPNFSDKGVDR